MEQVITVRRVVVVEHKKSLWQVAFYKSPEQIGENRPQALEVLTTCEDVQEALLAAQHVKIFNRGESWKPPVMMRFEFDAALRDARARSRAAFRGFPNNRVQHIRRTLTVLAYQAGSAKLHLTSQQYEALCRVVEGWYAGCTWTDCWWHPPGSWRVALLATLPVTVTDKTRKIVDNIIATWKWDEEDRLAVVA